MSFSHSEAIVKAFAIVVAASEVEEWKKSDKAPCDAIR